MGVSGLGAALPRVLSAAVLTLSLIVVIGMGATPTSAQQEVFVDMPSFEFSPVMITVPVGTKVTWTHSHPNIPHDVTSDTGLFSSPRRLMQGMPFSYTFTEAGTYPYTCIIHAMRNPPMKGVVVVTNQAAGAGSAVAATARPAATGTGGGAVVAAPTARPVAAATVPSSMLPSTGRVGATNAVADTGAGMSWMLLAGVALVAVGGMLRLRRTS